MKLERHSEVPVRGFGGNLRPGWGLHRSVWLIGLLALMWLAGQTSWSAPVPEYKVKAAFLYNITKFIDWPASRFGDTNSPIVIGILGPDPFGPLLEETFREKKVDGHPFLIQRVTSANAARDCHVLFISRLHKESIREVARSLQGEAILTVGESDRFARQGGMINFILVKDHVNLEINVGALEGVGLRASSKILSLATIVKPDAP